MVIRIMKRNKVVAEFMTTTNNVLMACDKLKQAYPDCRVVVIL